MRARPKKVHLTALTLSLNCFSSACFLSISFWSCWWAKRGTFKDMSNRIIWHIKIWRRKVNTTAFGWVIRTTTTAISHCRILSRGQSERSGGPRIPQRTTGWGTVGAGGATLLATRIRTSLSSLFSTTISLLKVYDHLLNLWNLRNKFHHLFLLSAQDPTFGVQRLDLCSPTDPRNCSVWPVVHSALDTFLLFLWPIDHPKHLEALQRAPSFHPPSKCRRKP